MRLNKFLQQSGVASRRKCDELIFNQHVRINGQIITEPYTQVEPQDIVLVHDQRIEPRIDKPVYFLLNKPTGYVCSHVGSKKVLDLLEEEAQPLFTVGRLDKHSEGLLLITNDGDFCQHVIHPANNFHKEYLVKTDQLITHDHLVRISHGCKIQHVHVKPVQVTKVRKNTLKITLSDGKKHEVRLLMANAQLETLQLKRIRIGPLTLSNLPVGAYRPLTEQELSGFNYRAKKHTENPSSTS